MTEEAQAPSQAKLRELERAITRKVLDSNERFEARLWHPDNDNQAFTIMRAVTGVDPNIKIHFAGSIICRELQPEQARRIETSHYLTESVGQLALTKLVGIATQEIHPYNVADPPQMYWKEQQKERDETPADDTTVDGLLNLLQVLQTDPHRPRQDWH